MNNTIKTYDAFVTLTAGEAFRLFPFGRVYKGGKSHDITPEFAKQIQLPHFSAPIKLGSHEDTTPAGGFITSLEIHEDGLYAVPEWNDAGRKAVEEGAFRFNSPEILWDGGLENPTDGSVIRAPMIVGTALLHTPHLGNAAALYSVEPAEKEKPMAEETIQVPVSFWDKFSALLAKPVEKKDEIKPELLTALQTERDEYKSKLEAREREEKEKALKAEIFSALQNKEKFGESYAEAPAADEAASVLAGMTPEQREWVMKGLAGLTAQIDATKIAKEKGSDGEGTADPKSAFNALVLNKAAEKKIDYNSAFEIVKAENRELFVDAFSKEK